MSQLHVASEVAPASWNESLRAVHGTIFHTVEWANSVAAEQPGARPDFYTLRDDDDLVAGMAVGFRASSSRNLTAAFSRRRWLDALPAMGDRSADDVSRFIRLIERDSQLAGDVTFRVGSFASPEENPC